MKIHSYIKTRCKGYEEVFFSKFNITKKSQKKAILNDGLYHVLCGGSSTTNEDLLVKTIRRAPTSTSVKLIRKIQEAERKKLNKKEVKRPLWHSLIFN